MVQEESIIDWQKEKEELTEGFERKWWNPKSGKHTVKFLSESEKYIGNFQGKEVKKIRFNVEVNGEKMDWSLTQGSTKNSLYGQIVAVAANNGALVGQTITLLITGAGIKTKYMISEAVELINK